MNSYTSLHGGTLQGKVLEYKYKSRGLSAYPDSPYWFWGGLHPRNHFILVLPIAFLSRLNDET